MRGDRAALHTSFLRTWTAFLTRCCSRVVFDPPVLPFVRCAHNDCQTMPLHQHRSTIFKHFRPRHSFRLKRFSVLSILLTQPSVFQCQASIRFAQVCCQHVFGCAPQLGRSRCAHAELGAVPELGEHDETWGAEDVDDSDPKLAVDLATQAFLDYLLDLADESKISAKDVCIFVLVCIESWDVRRCETHWVPP